MLGHDVHRPRGAAPHARSVARADRGPPEEIAPSSGGLGTDEVSRFAVRLVVIEGYPRDAARPLANDALADAGPRALASDALANAGPRALASAALADAGARGLASDALADAGPRALACDALADAGPRALASDALADAGQRALASDALANARSRAPASDGPRIVPFSTLPALLRDGDLLVVNDAATLPASLPGRTASGAHFELRLSGPVEPHRLAGVLLGEGDYHTRTEHRPAPPVLAVGDRVRIGSFVDGDGFSAVVTASAGRMIELATNLPDDELWRALYAAGSPVQYAHRADKLDLWTVQTAYASRPWAVEMPSAGRALTWDVLLGLRRAGVEVATLTHAAGLSSTGDEALDRALPWPERFEIPRRTVEAIAACKARGGRVIAVGTTVVRALEAAARQGDGSLRAGSGVATDRLGPASKLQIVDGLVSGLHSPGESHFELLRAFAPRERLERALSLAVAQGLSSHELGDACVILRS